MLRKKRLSLAPGVLRRFHGSCRNRYRKNHALHRDKFPLKRCFSGNQLALDLLHLLQSGFALSDLALSFHHPVKTLVSRLKAGVR